MKLKHWIRIVLFCLLGALIVWFASTLLCVANEKDDVGIYGFFKEPADSVDVVMIGSSGLYTYFYSPLAYEEQGFTSYSVATSTMKACLYPYVAEIAVEQQHPQLLIFETFGFTYDEQIDEVSLRKFLDSCPDSEVKQRAIADLVAEDMQSSFKFPFEKYHSGWTKLGECFQVLWDKIDMNKKGYSITKNFATTPVVYNYMAHQEDYHISEEGFVYLKQLLDYLKTADVENVLFLKLPETVQYVPDESYQQMIDMIREAGFDFVNLGGAIEDIGLDLTTDFYNATHLNVYGAEKFTSFFANYLMQRYQLNTDHTDKVTAEWDDCASYNDQILSRLKKLTDESAKGFLYTQRDFLER